MYGLIKIFHGFLRLAGVSVNNSPVVVTSGIIWVQLDGPVIILQGKLKLTGLPGTTLEFTVTRITPVSEAADGSNYFRIEAELDDAPAILRPGMEGIGKIEIDERRLLWIWTHRMFDWFRLTAWSWLP